MEFKERYTNTTDKDKIENKDKTVLSDDSYAIAEILNSILKRLEK